MNPVVVVVDDEPAIVDIVCDILDDVAIATQGCQRADQAHALIRQTQPWLVLLDVQMPGLDGVSIFHQLQADPATWHIPVIFCTANPTQLRECLPDYATRGVGLLPKPFRIPALLALVEQALAGGPHAPWTAPRYAHAHTLAV